MSRALAALALTAMMLAAPLAGADIAFPLAPLVEGPLGALDNVLSGIGGLAAPGAPLAPAAPLLLPVVDLGRLLVNLLRAFAQATVIGATDGDAGSSLGTPDAVGLVVAERTLLDGVRVPGANVSVPGQRVDVDTPAVNRTLRTPGVGVPPMNVTIPERRVNASVPPVDVPPVSLRVPGVNVTTPAVGTPPLRVETPEVRVPARSAELDLSGADVQVQRLRGTIYAGPVQVPYDAGPVTVGQSNLPPGIPRTARVETPEVLVLPGMLLLDQPGMTLAPSQNVRTQDTVVDVTPGTRVFPGMQVSEVVVPGQTASTPGILLLPLMEHRVVVPSQRVATLEIPGAALRTSDVVVTDQRVVLPGASVVRDAFGDVDNLGYVGYGRANDSSLYPFACTALVGCASAKPFLEPWVERVDSTLDAVMARVDGEVVVRV